MAPMELHLTFYINDPVSSDDLDTLATIAREAIDEKVGESDYMIEEVIGFDVDIQIDDSH